MVIMDSYGEGAKQSKQDLAGKGNINMATRLEHTVTSLRSLSKYSAAFGTSAVAESSVTTDEHCAIIIITLIEAVYYCIV